MSLSHEDQREGMWAAVWAVLAFVFGLGIVVGVLVRGWMGGTEYTNPTPIPTLSAPLEASAVASASTQSTTEVRQGIRLKATVPVIRTTTASQPPTSQKAQEGALNQRQVSQEPPAEQQEVVLELEIDQQVLAQAGASSSAGASASVSSPTSASTEHGRLGVVVAAGLPGVFAADWQVHTSGLPPWVLGQHLELGLDAVVNFDAVGAGITAGGKHFATGGAWLGYRGGVGWYLGVGARF